MSLRLARFLLLFSAFWLPVQTVAAMSVPLCRHVQEQAMAGIQSEQVDTATHCSEAAASDQAAHDAGCDNCEICHLACAGFMPSAPLAAGLGPAGHDFVLPAALAPPSHITEPLQHPPRAGA